MLCLGPGPPSLLHLTRANAEKPYAGDTESKIWIQIRDDLIGRIRNNLIGFRSGINHSRIASLQATSIYYFINDLNLNSLSV